MPPLTLGPPGPIPRSFGAFFDRILSSEDLVAVTAATAAPLCTLPPYGTLDQTKPAAASTGAHFALRVPLPSSNQRAPCCRLALVHLLERRPCGAAGASSASVSGYGPRLEASLSGASGGPTDAGGSWPLRRPDGAAEVPLAQLPALALAAPARAAGGVAAAEAAAARVNRTAEQAAAAYAGAGGAAAAYWRCTLPVVQDAFVALAAPGDASADA